MLSQTLLVINAILLLYCVYGLLFGIDAGCMNPFRIWRGTLSERDFDFLTFRILRAHDLEISQHYASGGGLRAWIANEYFGFQVNGTGRHSYLQKRRFFRALALTRIQRPECVVAFIGERALYAVKLPPKGAS